MDKKENLSVRSRSGFWQVEQGISEAFFIFFGQKSAVISSELFLFTSHHLQGRNNVGSHYVLYIYICYATTSVDTTVLPV